MRSWIVAGAALAAVLSAGAGRAQDVGQSDYRPVSELATEGFEPFSVGASSNAVFAMRNGREIYLCFLADTDELATARRDGILGGMAGTSQDRTVPNIPLVCILTE